MHIDISYRLIDINILGIIFFIVFPIVLNINIVYAISENQYLGGNMCHGMYRMHGNHGMNCCRRFPTKEEKIQHLEEYKKWLENEKKSVEEEIEELKKAS